MLGLQQLPHEALLSFFAISLATHGQHAYAAVASAAAAACRCSPSSSSIVKYWFSPLVRSLASACNARSTLSTSPFHWVHFKFCDVDFTHRLKLAPRDREARVRSFLILSYICMCMINFSYSCICMPRIKRYACTPGPQNRGSYVQPYCKEMHAYACVRARARARA